VVSLGELLDGLEAGRPFRGELAISFDDGYLDNYEFAAPVLEAAGLPATFFVATDFIGSRHVPAWDRGCARPPRWMDWDHVRSLRDRGFAIGAHTRSHAHLGELAGDEARDEIEGCRRELAERIGKPPDLFAYPYGQEHHLSAANRELVRAAGFRCCLSCFGGVNRSGADPFQLRRIGMGAWQGSPLLFAFDLALGRTLARRPG
jgi:peptidoglycan/xylan/chitin deacetylase (PgdA/CDA1 family)